MPSFVRDIFIKNVVLNDESIEEIHNAFMARVNTHNSAAQNEDTKLIPFYVIRFDGRGYRTFASNEAWSFYKGANFVERITLQAESKISLQTNHSFGETIEIRLDTDQHGSSYITVGGESKDWVETTFTTLETVINRRKDLATSIIRTHWFSLLLQIIGVVFGVLLALWLGTLSAPLLKGIDYPRVASFAFWLLIYSNLWSYLQQRLLIGIYVLFPNVRLSRSSEHWTHTLLRKGVEALAIAIILWILGWLTTWAASIISPFLIMKI
ncbi:hypothetical protein K5M36_03300 [Chromobacterium vaccinii]|nr:hypothetical protein [Chromobacterium vaccinii]